MLVDVSVKSWKGLLLRWVVDVLPHTTNRYYTNGFIITQYWKIPGFKVSVIVAVFNSLGKLPVLTDLLMLPVIGPDKQSLNGFSNIISSTHIFWNSILNIRLQMSVLLILQSMNWKENAAIWLFSNTLTLAKKKNFLVLQLTQFWNVENSSV